MSDLLLKWPGGKRWLSSTIEEILATVTCATYYEPFLGGGAAFFRCVPKTAVLSDINERLVECFVTVRDFPDDVVKAIRGRRNSRVTYLKMRSAEYVTAVERAAQFIYLNRTCWGGIYRLNRLGKFNVPFGNSGRPLKVAELIRATAGNLAGAEIVRADFEKMIALAGSGDVVYADPPYTTVGECNGFIRYNERLFSWADQKRLARAAGEARGRGAVVMVSGLLHPEVVRLYEGWFVARLQRRSRVARVVEARRSVTEILVVSQRPKILSASLSFERIDKALISHLAHDGV